MKYLMKHITKFLLALLLGSPFTNAQEAQQSTSDSDPDWEYVLNALKPFVNHQRHSYHRTEEYYAKLQEPEVRQRLLLVVNRYAKTDLENDVRAYDIAMRAIGKLRHISEDDVVEAIAPYLKSTSPYVRRSAVEAIAENPKAIPYLIDALHDAERGLPTHWGLMDSSDYSESMEGIKSFTAFKLIVEALAEHHTEESLAAIDELMKRVAKDYDESDAVGNLLEALQEAKERGIQEYQ